MKYLIISLFMFFSGHLTLSSQPCYMEGEEYNNKVLEKQDSVVRKRNSQNGFEEIYVKHTNKVCLIDLKPSEAWEVREYALRQKNIFKQMEYNIIKQISAQTLKMFLECKSNPVICKLIIILNKGIIREVSFQMNQKASSVFTNDDILKFERIILNTHFSPDDSLSGDIAVYYWAISRKRIKEYLDTNR